MQLNLSDNQLCGVWMSALNLVVEGTYTAEGITAIAKALKVNRSLMRLDVAYNSVDKGGNAVLEDAVEGRKGFELLTHDRQKSLLC